MKKILLIIAILAMAAVISSCKKSSANNTTVTPITNADLAGNWKGRMSSTVSSTLAKIIFDSTGHATLTDSVGGAVLTGSYIISDDSVIISVIAGLTHISFRFKLINNLTTLEGKWINMTGTTSGLVVQEKVSSTVLSNGNVKGKYEGRYSLNPSPTYTTLVKFIFDAAGNATLTDSIGGGTFSGTYTITGDSLITTLTGSSVVNFRFKVTNAVSRFDGKWINLSGSASGLIYQDRK